MVWFGCTNKPQNAKSLKKFSVLSMVSRPALNRRQKGRGPAHKPTMTIYHDEIEIEDFEYDDNDEMYYYPCPCGDRFQISKEELMAGEEVATCPSCSLVVKVIYDMEKFQAETEEDIRKESDKEAVKV